MLLSLTSMPCRSDSSPMLAQSLLHGSALTNGCSSNCDTYKIQVVHATLDAYFILKPGHTGEVLLWRHSPAPL